VRDVEAAVADDDARRQVVAVDERDARLRARIADDEADEGRDHERVREQRAEQQRRAQERAHVLHEDAPHASRPSTSSSTRSACDSSSSW
jgi:hypothetical protein